MCRASSQGALVSMRFSRRPFKQVPRHFRAGMRSKSVLPPWTLRLTYPRNPSPSERRRSISPAAKPQSASARRPPSPRSGGAPRTSGGVREKRGAGAACSMPAIVTKFSRATLCGWRYASLIVSTGAKHASDPSKAIHHSSRVFVLKTAVKRVRRAGHPTVSFCFGNGSPATPRRFNRSA